MYLFHVPFHVIFLRGIRQALACNKTGPSIGHASILLHAWSPKNGGWVQSIHCPCVEPSRGRMDTSIAPYFFLLFFLDKSRKLSKIVSVLRSASVERFDVSRMRDFHRIGLLGLFDLVVAKSVHMFACLSLFMQFFCVE